MGLVDKEIDSYSERFSKAESDVLKKLNRDTHLKVLRPRMLSGHLQGKLLQMISRMIQPKVVLEIGTYTGYATICLSAGLQDKGIIHTIEINEELEDFAKGYFKEAGIIDKVKYHLGEAKSVLKNIDDKIDLVFIDADKENYINYYEMIIGQVNSGGFILADNVLWDGKVLEKPDPHDQETIALQAFNKHVLEDDRVDNLMLPFRDGLMIVQKK